MSDLLQKLGVGDAAQAMEEVQNAAIREQLADIPQLAYYNALAAHFIAREDRIKDAAILRDELLKSIGYVSSLPELPKPNSSYDPRNILVQETPLLPVPPTEELEKLQQKLKSAFGNLGEPQRQIPVIVQEQHGMDEQKFQFIAKDVADTSQALAILGLDSSGSGVEYAREIMQQQCIDLYGMPLTEGMEDHKQLFWQELEKLQPNLTEEERRDLSRLWEVEEITADELLLGTTRIDATTSIERELLRTDMRLEIFRSFLGGKEYKDFTPAEKGCFDRISRSSLLARQYTAIIAEKSEAKQEEILSDYVKHVAANKLGSKWAEVKCGGREEAREALRQDAIRQSYGRGVTAEPSDAERRDWQIRRLQQLQRVLSADNFAASVQNPRQAKILQQGMAEFTSLLQARDKVVDLIEDASRNSFEVLASLTTEPLTEVMRNYDKILAEFLVQDDKEQFLANFVAESDRKASGVEFDKIIAKTGDPQKFLQMLDMKKIQSVLQEEYLAKNLKMPVKLRGKTVEVDVRETQDVMIISDFLAKNKDAVVRAELQQRLVAEGYQLQVIDSLGAGKSSRLAGNITPNQLLPCVADASALDEGIQYLHEKEVDTFFAKMQSDPEFFAENMESYCNHVLQAGVVIIQGKKTDTISETKKAKFMKDVAALQEKYKDRGSDPKAGEKYKAELFDLTNKFFAIEIYGSLLHGLEKVESKLLRPVLEGKAPTKNPAAFRQFLQELGGANSAVRSKQAGAADKSYLQQFMGKIEKNKKDRSLKEKIIFALPQKIVKKHGKKIVQKKVAANDQRFQRLKARSLQVRGMLDAVQDHEGAYTVPSKEGSELHVFKIVALDMLIPFYSDVIEPGAKLYTHAQGDPGIAKNKLVVQRSEFFTSKADLAESANSWAGKIAQVVQGNIATPEQERQLTLTFATFAVVEKLCGSFDLAKDAPEDLKSIFAEVAGTKKKWQDFEADAREKLAKIRMLVSDPVATEAHKKAEITELVKDIEAARQKLQEDIMQTLSSFERFPNTSIRDNNLTKVFMLVTSQAGTLRAIAEKNSNIEGKADFLRQGDIAAEPVPTTAKVGRALADKEPAKPGFLQRGFNALAGSIFQGGLKKVADKAFGEHTTSATVGLNALNDFAVQMRSLEKPKAISGKNFVSVDVPQYHANTAKQRAAIGAIIKDAIDPTLPERKPEKSLLGGLVAGAKNSFQKAVKIGSSVFRKITSKGAKANAEPVVGDINADAKARSLRKLFYLCNTKMDQLARYSFDADKLLSAMETVKDPLQREILEAEYLEKLGTLGSLHEEKFKILDLLAASVNPKKMNEFAKVWDTYKVQLGCGNSTWQDWVNSVSASFSQEELKLTALSARYKSIKIEAVPKPKVATQELTTAMSKLQSNKLEPLLAKANGLLEQQDLSSLEQGRAFIRILTAIDAAATEYKESLATASKLLQADPTTASISTDKGTYKELFSKAEDKFNAELEQAKKFKTNVIQKYSHSLERSAKENETTLSSLLSKAAEKVQSIEKSEAEYLADRKGGGFDAKLLSSIQLEIDGLNQLFAKIKTAQLDLDTNIEAQQSLNGDLLEKLQYLKAQISDVAAKIKVAVKGLESRQDLLSQLHTAIMKRDGSLLKTLLTQEKLTKDVKFLPWFIKKAAETGNIEALQIMQKSKFQELFSTDLVKECVFAAIATKQSGVIKFLLEQPDYKFLLHEPNEQGDLPLHQAVKLEAAKDVAGAMAMTELLLGMGASSDSKDAKGNLPHYLVSSRDLRQLLLSDLALITWEQGFEAKSLTPQKPLPAIAELPKIKRSGGGWALIDNDKTRLEERLQFYAASATKFDILNNCLAELSELKSGKAAAGASIQLPGFTVDAKSSSGDLSKAQELLLQKAEDLQRNFQGCEKDFELDPLDKPDSDRSKQVAAWRNKNLEPRLQSLQQNMQRLQRGIELGKK